MDLPLLPLIAIRFPRGKRRIEKIGRFRAKQAVPRVRIHSAPPSSLRFEAFSGDDRKKRVCGGRCARPTGTGESSNVESCRVTSIFSL
jgi:hypothetical protein